jgi:hypothetical protein
MMLRLVSDFVPHHRGQPRIGFCVLEDAGKDGDFAPRQTKRVDHLLILDHRKLPLVLRLVRNLRDPFPHPLNQFVSLRVVADRRLPQHFAIGAEAERQFLFLRKENQLVPSRPWGTVAAREAPEQAQRRSGPECRADAERTPRAQREHGTTAYRRRQDSLDRAAPVRTLLWSQFSHRSFTASRDT